MQHSVSSLIYSEETKGYYNISHVVCFEPYVSTAPKEEYQKEEEVTAKSGLKPYTQLDKEREEVLQYFVAILLVTGKPVFIEASSEMCMQELLENYVSKFG